jgi:hypothetical protein
MDHPCHKCGNSIEDGKPFCSQCGAPQIRVAVPEAAEPSNAGDVPANEATAFSLEPPNIPGALSVSALSTGVVWSSAFRACAVAALIAFLVTALRLIVPPLAVLGAGFLAVILYRRRNPTWRVNAGSGAQLGAFSGLIFSGILAFFAALMLAMWQAGGQLHQSMLDALQQFSARSNDPQVRAALEFLKAPDLAGKMLLDIAVLALISIAGGSIAGAVTGAFLSRKNRS